jgi:hypothetical protein
MICRTAEDVVESSQYTKVFAHRSEVNDGLNYLESSLYHAFFTSTRSRIQQEDNKKITTPNDDLQWTNRALIPNVVDEGRQAEQSASSM